MFIKRVIHVSTPRHTSLNSSKHSNMPSLTLRGGSSSSGPSKKRHLTSNLSEYKTIRIKITNIDDLTQHVNNIITEEKEQTEDDKKYNDDDDDDGNDADNDDDEDDDDEEDMPSLEDEDISAMEEVD